tara:strand:+ start:1510 stop:2559 length:1050 start_codon:yes stop_codon:yes gene_type:complete
MATLPVTNLTLADWAKRRDPDGSMASVANILSQSNEILDDGVFKQANGATSHRVTVATGLPDVYWRQVNQGIYPSHGTTAQIDEGIGMLESRSEVDIALAELEDDERALRLSEARLRLESMNQEMATTMFYGNTAANPEKFMGLAPRFSSLSAGNSQNILSAGGSTANTQTSIYLMGWSDETCHFVFPKGSSAGLEQRDLGEQSVDVFNAAGAYTGKMQALVDWFCWKMGLVVKDWRYAGRIPNIEVDDITGAGAFTGTQTLTSYGTSILHRMAELIYRIPNLGMVKPCFYMNRTVHSFLSRLAMEKQSGVLTIESGLSSFGTARRYLSFMGIPIRRCDAILNTEAVVS